MRLHFTWSRAAVVAAALVLPIKAGGCGSSTACFTFSQAAYDKAGACPASGVAISRFSDTSCGEIGPISSVNGEGSFDGEFCCYPVTQANDFFECGSGGGFFGGSGGFFGAGGSGGIGGVFDAGPTTGITTVTGVGGAGGMLNCFSCSEQLSGASMDPGELCASAATFWSALNTCNCGSGPCTMACSATACTGVPPSPECKLCMADTSMAGCGSQLADCMAN